MIGTPILERLRRDYDIEIEGVKRETLRAQEEHEGLVAIRDRLESDRSFVEQQLGKIKVILGKETLEGVTREEWSTVKAGSIS